MTLIKPIAMLKSKFSTINPMIALFVTLDQIPSTTRRITRMNITANFEKGGCRKCLTNRQPAAII